MKEGVCIIERVNLVEKKTQDVGRGANALTQPCTQSLSDLQATTSKLQLSTKF